MSLHGKQWHVSATALTPTVGRWLRSAPFPDITVSPLDGYEKLPSGEGYSGLRVSTGPSLHDCLGLR